MTPDSWRRVEEVFHEALEMAPEAREAFLQDACADNAALLERVQSLLRYHDVGEDFLENTPALPGMSVPDPEALLSAREREDAERLIGTRVGAYELVELLGLGGMGSIFLAQRADHEFEKRVAIKFIRRGMDQDEVLRRFRAERQALALLEHPNITRLLDGGVTADGHPYLVMELVDGRPIDRYCDDEHLSADARLELFIPVCHAVAYAHANLIVHRDLKPNNVLVTADGTPKLLDFGIAKILHAGELGTTTLTQGPMHFMTLYYASPEQLLGQAITTSTDVYSLGVLLYELLSGRRPYRLTTDTPFELERAICEADPERLSSIRPALAGDVEAIVLKALRKEPDKRYASADRLAEDIRAYLDGLPVSARKGTLRYRAGKLIRRYRLLFSLLAVLGLAVSVGTTGVWVQSVRVRHERDLVRAAEARARAEADNAARRRAWMSYLFSREEPPGSGRVPILDALEEVRGEILATTADQPDERLRLLENLADLYSSLALGDQAADLERQVLETRLADAHASPLDIAAVRHQYAQHLSGAGKPEAAAEQIELALSVRRAQLGDDDPRVLRSRHLQGLIRWAQGDYEGSIAILEENLAHRQRTLAATDPDLVDSRIGLGSVLLAAGRPAEAERHFRLGLALAQRVFPGSSPTTARAWVVLGGAQQALGDYAAAEASYETGLAMTRELFWDTHSSVLNIQTQLAVLYMDMGQYDRAIELNQRVLDDRTRLYPTAYWVLARTWWHQAQILEAAGRMAEAQEAGNTSLALYEKHFADDPRETARVVALLARTHHALGDAQTAEALFLRSLKAYRATLPNHREAAHVAGSLGMLYVEQGRVAEARPLLEESYRILQRTLGEDHKRTREAKARLDAL